MKTILIALALMSTVAMANHGRQINDLMYFPGAKTWNSTTELSKSTTNGGGTETELMNINQEVGYSLKDNSRMIVDFNYNIDFSTKSAGTAEIDNYASGVDAVNLTYKHRVMEKDHRRVDVAFTLSPSLGAKRSASTTVEGNNRVGRDQYALSAEYGNAVNKDLSYAFGYKFTNQSTAKTISATGGESFTAARNNQELSAKLQWDKEMCFFRGELGYTMEGNTDSASATPTENDPFMSWILTYGHRFAKDNHLLTVALLNVNAETNTIPATTASKTHTSSLTLGYTYQF